MQVPQPPHFVQFIDLNDIIHPGDERDTEDDEEDDVDFAGDYGSDVSDGYDSYGGAGGDGSERLASLGPASLGPASLGPASPGRDAGQGGSNPPPTGQASLAPVHHPLGVPSSQTHRPAPGLYLSSPPDASQAAVHLPPLPCDDVGHPPSLQMGAHVHAHAPPSSSSGSTAGARVQRLAPGSVHSGDVEAPLLGNMSREDGDSAA